RAATPFLRPVVRTARSGLSGIYISNASGKCQFGTNHQYESNVVSRPETFRYLSRSPRMQGCSHFLQKVTAYAEGKPARREQAPRRQTPLGLSRCTPEHRPRSGDRSVRCALETGEGEGTCCSGCGRCCHASSAKH